MKNWFPWFALSGGLVLLCLLAGPTVAQESTLRKLSGPLTLAEAIQIAQQNNLDIQISEQEVEISKADVQISRSARLPLLTLGAAYTLANDPLFYTLSGGPGNIPRNSAGEFNLGLSLPLFTGGKLEAQESEAVANREAVRFDLSTRRSLTTLAVRQTYHQVQLAQAQVQVYLNYVAQREAALANTRERFAVGKVPRVYVLRDETELATAKQTRLAARTLEGSAMTDLKQQLSVDHTSNFTLTDTLELRKLTIDLAQILEVARKKNPELAALRLRIEVAEAQLRIANAIYWPQVNLYGQGEVRTPQSDGFGNGGSLIVAATLPVLDFGGRSAQVDKASANVRKAQLQLVFKEQDLIRLTTRSWLELQQAAQTIELTQTSIAQASEENRLAQERFAVGRSIQVEVLDSSVALLKSRLLNIKAIYDYDLALAQIEQITNVEIY